MKKEGKAMFKGFFAGFARMWWLMLISGIIIGMMAGCSQSSSSPAQVIVDESSNSKTVKVALGGSLQVALNSNHTTGYSWELNQISDTTILEKVSNTYETPQATGEKPLVGAGGKELWNFKALKKGTAAISMEYSQPWSGGTKGAQKFNLTVTVE
jgi:inhibitor of cysteine peptidase